VPSISLSATRSNVTLIRDGVELLHENPDEMRTLEAVNTLLSAYGERGDVRDLLNLFDLAIDDWGIEPNHESFSFAMEGLGKDIHRRRRSEDDSYVHRNVEMADNLLTMMERANVAPTSDIVRNYVELLFLAGEADVATDVIYDCLSRGNNYLVNNKTIYRAAVANAIGGKIEVAKDLASLTSETIPLLARKIKTNEQRHCHLEAIQKPESVEKSEL